MAEVDDVVARRVEAHAEAARPFSSTDPERLDALLERLDADRIVARQDVGYTQQDLGEEMRELLEERPEARVWVAFHRQDIEGVLGVQPLYLAYLHQDGADADAGIGREVADQARAAGFEVRWDGDPAKRIELHGVRWEHRRG